MSSVKVQFTGWDEAIKALGKIPDEVSARIKRDGLVKACGAVVVRAKELCPGPGYPGDKPDLKPLRDTLGFVIRGYENATVGIIGPQYPAGAHGHIVHKGTKPHTIRVRDEGGKTTLASESVYFGKEVSHPGQAGQPFLESAARETQDAQQKAIVGSILAAVDEITQAQAG